MSKHTTRSNFRCPLVISWDNPVPANSKRMIRQLKNTAALRKRAKTVVALTPCGQKYWRKVRRTIVSNLHPSRGRAVYANLNSRRAFEYGRSTGYKWKEVA